jgi:hypothetical protein
MSTLFHELRAFDTTHSFPRDKILDPPHSIRPQRPRLEQDSKVDRLVTAELNIRSGYCKIVSPLGDLLTDPRSLAVGTHVV